jgi:hypothetical protein
VGIGLEIDYVKCLFCGNTKPLHSHRGTFRPGELEVSPVDFKVIQIRKVLPGPGRGKTETKGFHDGYGFKVVGGFSIVEMLEDPKYRDLALSLKDRLVKIVRSYMEAGVISREEI